MKLVLIGPQGCGKGTQAILLSKKLNIPHISAGALLKKAPEEFKQKIKIYVNQGLLVPDTITIETLRRRISEQDCENGFILDGFPRNLEQARELNKITQIDKIIEIEISDQEAVKRISSRLSCPNCDAVFNKLTNPPKQENICDNCNSELIIREDDTEQAVKQRLEIYRRDTSEILKYYNSIKINGEQSIQKVHKDILEAINSS